MVRIIFYSTVATGQVVEADISYDGKKYTCKGNESILKQLLPAESEGSEIIFAALRAAPERFDGRYLRAEYIDPDAKGSSESGHYDHTGLPGVWGGSRPTGRADDAEGEPPSSTEVSAKDIRSAAEKAEPGITKDILAVAKEHDAEMFQLDKRLKSTPSIKRRLDFFVGEGLSLDQAEEKLVDSVRYTMVLDDGVYTEKAKSILAALEDRGWKEYPIYSENYWESGIGFEGYCCVFVKGSRAFELQFHTPSGIKILPESHRLYEKWRVMKPGPERDMITEKMLALWDTVATPLECFTIRGKRIGK